MHRAAHRKRGAARAKSLELETIRLGKASRRRLQHGTYAITWRPLAQLEFERRLSLDNGSPPYEKGEKELPQGRFQTDEARFGRQGGGLGGRPTQVLSLIVPQPPAAYRVLAGLAFRLLPLAGLLSTKLAAGDRERRRALDRWRAWARDHRDPARPRLWVHAPSVGEGLQANAVLGLLRNRHPEWQIVYSFFSPSAQPLAARQPVDHADFLPYDTKTTMAALVEAIGARALVFTKLDLWPCLATSAAEAGTRVGMIAGTVSPISGRLHPLARWLAHSGYQALELVGAIDAPDAARLKTLGVSPAAIEITGDPRFDSALHRARLAVPAEIAALTAAGPPLVAGSTWPEDERIVLEAFAAVRSGHPAARLVLVPHEPTADHLGSIEAAAGRLGLAVRRLSGLQPGETPECLVVDRTGILASLYPGAMAGFVGGGFGHAGLHSVLEPAAAGLPVAFGPRWQSSREAGLLLAAKAAIALPTADRAAAALADLWRGWLDRPADRHGQGRRALAVVENELGAADRSAELIERLMAVQRPTTTPS